MTTTAPEQTAPVFDYQTLDDWSEEIAAVVVAYWYLRPTMPEVDWFAMITGVIAGFVVRSEYAGRIYGARAVPVVGDFAFPEPPTKPYRPIPRDFEQVSGIAPKPDDDLDLAKRLDEVIPQIEKAVRTLAAEIERPASYEAAVEQKVDRVERFAKDEPVAAMQRGYQDGIRTSSPEVVGYRRSINPDACELCFWLWKDGFVYPIDQPMHRHTGCRCVPIPTTESIGRHPLPEDQVALAETLYERYTSETLRETSFRRDTKAQEA